MSIIILLVSYKLMSILFLLVFLGILVIGLKLTKKLFNMNEEKWTSFFNKNEGIGAYYIILIPYLLSTITILPLSIYWFRFINFDHAILISFSIIFIFALLGIFKLSKIKHMIKKKFNENFN